MIGALTVALVPIAATPAPHVAASTAPPVVGAPSRFAPVGPLRLADTREAVCGCTPVDPATIRVQIAGRDGIASGITAAAVTITAAGAGRHRVRDGVSGWDAATGDVDPQPPGRARHGQLRHRAGQREWRDRRLRERGDRPHRRRHRHVHPDIVRHRRPVRARRPHPAARHTGTGRRGAHARRPDHGRRCRRGSAPMRPPSR